MRFYEWKLLIISYHPAKFGGHRCYDSGGIMFLLIEGQDSTWPCVNPLLLFISKALGRIAWWLATCARKPKGGSGREELNRYPPPSPAVP